MEWFVSLLTREQWAAVSVFVTLISAVVVIAAIGINKPGKKTDKVAAPAPPKPAAVHQPTIRRPAILDR